MSRSRIVVAGVLTLAVAGGAGVAALWDDMPWAGEDRDCAKPSASVRTEIEAPAEQSATPPRPVLSPDGRHVLYPVSEPVLADVATGRTVRAYDGRYPRVVSFRADGSSFLTHQVFENENGTADGIALWDVRSDEAIQVFPGEYEPFVPKDKQRGLIRDIAVGPDGKLVAISSADGAVRLWDVRTGRNVATLKERSATKEIQQFQTSSLAFSPDGERLALADTEGKVSVWQTGSRKLEQQLTAPGTGGIEVTFSPDGRYLAVREYGATQPAYNQDVWVVELATRRGLQVADHHHDPVRAMRFSPDSASIVTITMRGSVERTALAGGTATPLLQICGAEHLMVGADATTAVAMVPSADRTVFELATYPLP